MKIPNVLNKLFANKYFLYLVIILSVLTNLGYLYAMHFSALFFFFLVGFITLNFSKNMSIVLTTCLLASSFFIAGNKIHEGFEDAKKDVTKDVKDITKGVKKAVKRTVHTKANAKGSAALSGADHPSVDDILNPDAIKNLTAETMELMGEQKKLFASMNNMAPLLEQAKSLLAGFDMKQLNSLAALSKNGTPDMDLLSKNKGVAADASAV